MLRPGTNPRIPGRSHLLPSEGSSPGRANRPRLLHLEPPDGEVRRAREDVGAGAIAHRGAEFRVARQSLAVAPRSRPGILRQLPPERVVERVGAREGPRLDVAAQV